MLSTGLGSEAEMREVGGGRKDGRRKERKKEEKEESKRREGNLSPERKLFLQMSPGRRKENQMLQIFP